MLTEQLRANLLSNGKSGATRRTPRLTGFPQRRVLFPVRASGRLRIAGAFIAGIGNFATKSMKRTTEKIDI